MIQKTYDDGKKHVHLLSFGAGTQSTALLLMALKGEINGVIPDYIIFADTGWEPRGIYDWIDKVNAYIKRKFDREIIVTSGRNIRDDIVTSDTGRTVHVGNVNEQMLGDLPFITRWLNTSNLVR